MALLAPLSAAVQARGAECTLTPSMSLGMGYNDNILFSGSNEKSGFYTVSSPALQLTRRDERGELNMAGKLSSFVYAGNGAFDSIDTEISADGKYALTPRLSVNASGQYKTDSQPDSYLTTTGLVSTNTQSEKNQQSLGLDWDVSEVTSLDGQMSFGKTQYENQAYSDYRVQTYGLGLKRKLDRLLSETTGLANLSYSRYDYTLSRSHYATATLGFLRNINEKYSLTAWAGPSLIETDYTFAPFQTTRQWGATTHLALDETLEKSTINLTFTYDLEPDSLSDTSVKRAALSGSYLYRITYELSAGITASYFNNKSAGQGNALVNAVDENTYNIGPRLLYQINNDWGVEADYRFSRIISTITDSSRTQNSIFIQINWNHSFNRRDWPFL
jgi:hypothetical protein